VWFEIVAFGKRRGVTLRINLCLAIGGGGVRVGSLFGVHGGGPHEKPHTAAAIMVESFNSGKRVIDGLQVRSWME